MNKLPIALALAAITAGSAHAVDKVYSFEDFELGTVNYTGTTVVDASTTAGAFANTDYYPRSTSRMGIVANADPIPGGPTGQHAFISTSGNRIMATAPLLLTLATDSIQTVDVSFSYMMYGFDAVGAVGSFELRYSPSGSWADAVRIATIGLGQAGSTVVTPDNVTAAQATWYTLTVSFDAADVGGVFTNTGEIGFNRIGLIAQTGVTTTNQYVYLDDITVTGVPAAAPAAPFMATITPAVDPATGYDIQWPSQTGATYTLFTNTDLATPIDSWTVVEAAIAPTPPQNTYNVPANGPRRFYAVKELNP